MKRKETIIKDKALQERAIEDARKKADAMGLKNVFSFNSKGQMLVDGMTADQIRKKAEDFYFHYYRQNIQFIDPSLRDLSNISMDKMLHTEGR